MTGLELKTECVAAGEPTYFAKIFNGTIFKYFQITNF